MRKQITVTVEERDVIEGIAEQLGNIEEGKRIAKVLGRLVTRWDKAKEQKFFRKGGENGK